MRSYWQTELTYLKGVGPQKAELLATELGLHTFRDLINLFPRRYRDKSQIVRIADIYEPDREVFIKAQLNHYDVVGKGRAERLVAWFADGSAEIQISFFGGQNYLARKLKIGDQYFIFGKSVKIGNKYSVNNAEIEPADESLGAGFYEPVYPLTDKLRKKYMDNRFFNQLIRKLLDEGSKHITDFFADDFLRKYGLIHRQPAYNGIHFPKSKSEADEALRRFKFEELFFKSLNRVELKLQRRLISSAFTLTDQSLLTRFLSECLPFTLTNHQAGALNDIISDLKSGRQMNRLLQGDVGSGKTVVAFAGCLMAIASGYQAAVIVPTEILARQHFANFQTWCNQLGIKVELMVGATTKKNKQLINTGLSSGYVNLIVGTHALLEDTVAFNNLAFCVIDEQHRFGVAQRARLLGKNTFSEPHMLVMSATPIPRTLSLSYYGDLDISVISELPPGRKPVTTAVRPEAVRNKVYQFIAEKVAEGQQAYYVFPLIEESEKVDLQNLEAGYLRMCDFYAQNPELGINPDQVIYIHGKLSATEKDEKMQAFVSGVGKVLVSTTVIEVGVNVPTSTIMLIESAERFGLAQLHQLRGRVGRGADKSYCILLHGPKLSQTATERLNIMAATNDGFLIAEKDLELRGAGDILGTKQSGDWSLKLASLPADSQILELARDAAFNLFANQNPKQTYPEIFEIYGQQQQGTFDWSRIA